MASLNSSKLLIHLPHIRFNIKGECDSVHRKLRQQSSDVEIVDDMQEPPTPLLGKHHWDQSPQETPTPTQARLDLQEDFNSCHALSLSPMPPLFPTSYADLDSESHHAILSSTPPLTTSTLNFDSLLPTPSLTATSSTSSVIAVHIPIYDPAKRQGWPHAMYTIDMAVGFQQMSTASLHTRFNQETLFSLIFGGTPFIRATYHQNRKSWLETELSILEAHKKAGCTRDGLWSNYLDAQHLALGEHAITHALASSRHCVMSKRN
ncbi:hypothetical protein EV702DRAFT_1051226 [Suillus placidus]|uniref:Uncharacterized protein n=1 Tax=Suillus placidus TaxID=48579 RepID=A0A9P7CW73_9AGAM|nr:hypothetical protein EV702DRAFT_1051226 [Suillus placidus]